MAAPNTPASNAHNQQNHASNNSDGLKTWWSGFKRRGKKDAVPAPVVEAPRGIFGVPLQDSIKYANVAISLMDEDGKSFIYGYVPIVVAKCGVFLKEKATDVEGIFRLNGSAKRIKELQAQFDQPTRYGKGLDWTGYTVHDAANVLRRYLNQLPQPIVPLEAYERFRDPLRDHQSQALGDSEAHSQDIGNFNHEKAIKTYQQLITELPPLNRQLLLYVLDLLSVFASKSDVNRMTSANLSAIFQPGLLSHPEHDMKPQEYRLSQDVLIFLIDNQDSFLIGMNGTAADEKTVLEVQSGIPTPQAATPTKGTQSGLGRSASSASAGTDSQRKLGSIRRNLSVSSRNSRGSAANSHAPNTPSSGQFVATGSGVHRSNTVPSKKSPALSSRFNRGMESPNTPSALSPPLVAPTARSVSPGSKLVPTPGVNEPTSRSNSPLIASAVHAGFGTHSAQQTTAYGQSKERLVPGDTTSSQASHELAPGALGTPGKSRNLSALLKSSPTSDSKESRQPNKLKKKRMPSSTQPSANSSTHSLHDGDGSPRNAVFHTPMVTPGLGIEADPISTSQNSAAGNSATKSSAQAGPRLADGANDTVAPAILEASQQPSESTLKPTSRNGSMQSNPSGTDHSEHELGPDNKGEKAEKKRRWRFSSAAKKNDQPPQLASPPLIGTNHTATASTTSVGSWSRARRSVSHHDIPAEPLEPVASGITQPSEKYSEKSDNSASKDRDTADEAEKKGLFGRLRNRIHNSREERKEREAEKERAKSPPRAGEDRNNSKHSLSAIAAEGLPPNDTSFEAAKNVPGTIPEAKVQEADLEAIKGSKGESPEAIPGRTPVTTDALAHTHPGQEQGQETAGTTRSVEVADSEQPTTSQLST